MKTKLFYFLMVLFFASCGTYHYPNASGIRESQPKEVNSYYIDTTQSYVYRAKLKAFESDIDGSLLIKTIARNHHRVSLVSDAGQTLFDVSILPEEHNLHYAAHGLNKRLVAREITNIFRTMTAQRHPTSALMFADQQQYYPVYMVDNCYYVLKDRKVERITQVKGSKEYVSIHYRAWDENDVPVSISVEHKKFPLAMDLALDEEQAEKE